MSRAYVKVIICQFILSIIFCSGVVGQELPGIVFQNYTVKDGLSDISINCLIKDKQGFIWIGTQNGLNKFDGVDFYKYDHLPIKDQYIRHILEDSKERLFVASNQGVTVLDPVKGTHWNIYLLSSSGDHVIATFIAADDSSRYWIGTTQGVYLIDEDLDENNQEDIYVRKPLRLLEEIYVNVIREINEVLYIGTSSGLFIYDLETEEVIHKKNAENEILNVKELFLNQHDELIIGTDRQGIYVLPVANYKSKAILKFDVPDELHELSVEVVHQDEMNNYWIGTNGEGLVIYSHLSKEFDFYTNDPFNFQSLSNNTVDALLEDDLGQVWVGTWQGFGVAVNVIKSFRYHAYLPGNNEYLNHNLIMPILESVNGDLWVATSGKGVNRKNKNTDMYTVFSMNESTNGLNNDEVWAMYERSATEMWFGTLGGGINMCNTYTGKCNYLKYHPGEGNKISSKTNRIYSLTGDSKDNVWIGTHDAGLNRFDLKTGEIEHYLFSEIDDRSIGSNEVNPVFESADGNIWVGTYGGGLNRLDSLTNTFERFEHIPGESNSLSSNLVSAINEFPDGILWIASLNSGFDRFDYKSKEFTHYNTSNGLPNNAVSGILIDREGFLWISTSEGISRFDPESEEFKNYDTRDGLQGDIFHIGSYHANAHGEMFFGGNNGLNSFYPTYLNELDSIPPNLYLTKLRVHDREVLPDENEPIDKAIAFAEQIYLTQQQNNFSIDFAALHFKRPWRHEYKYRLVGVDENWRTPDGLRRASYQNLNDGTYRFEVKAANSDGFWTSEPTTILVIIAPFWYETWWALIIWSVCGGLVVFGIVRWRTRAVEERANQLEVTVKERTAEIEEQNNQLEEQAHQLLEMDRVKSTFFANISHEFRTPLTTILGPIQDTLNGAHGPVKDRLRNLLLIVQRSGMTLKDLIDQLLALTKLEAGEMLLYPRKTDLVQYVQYQLRSFDFDANRKDIAISFQHEDASLEAYLDTDKLKYIFNNLLSNALKFTHKGGTITVHLSSVMDEASSAWVQLSIEDTGIGISEDALPYIFERFHQGDASSTRLHEGTGIGLALTKQLVELHKGKITVESALGRGSNFIVQFPVGENHLPAGSIQEGDWVPNTQPEQFESGDDDIFFDPDTKVPQDAPRVLLVEDREDVRAYVRSLLEHQYQIFEAENGKVGFEKAKEVHPDLIISDVMMPEVDGFEMVKMIKAEPALTETRIMMLTARVEDEDLLTGLREGADAYLVKPFNSTELQIRVENLIEVRKAIAANRIERGATTIALDSQDTAFIKKVKSYIEAHISSVKVTDVAEEVLLGPKQLNRRLHAIVGMSARAYIQMIRLEIAAQMLEVNHDQIAQIAYEVGYKDAGHFTRVFRTAYGVTPSDYISGARNEGSST